MRATLTATILLSALLAGCASTKNDPGNKNISQAGALKAGERWRLLGQPVPAELQQDMRVAAVASAPSAPAAAGKEAPMKMDDAGLRTQRSVYFDFNSSALKSDSEPALKAHARYLASNPKARVRIEGNADERGPVGYNSLLGLKRADNVRQSIIGYGAPEKQVLVKSLGESKPKLKGHDEESWAENRRADVVYERDE